MKNLLKFLRILFIAFYSFIICNGIIADPQSEIYFLNKIENRDLYVRFYPVGSVFNGDEQLYPPSIYSLRAKNIIPHDPNSGVNRKRGGDKLKYIIGLDGYALSHYNDPNSDSLYFKVESTTEISYSKWMLLGHDATANSTEMDGLFGYGSYRLEIYTHDSDHFDFITSIPIDWLDFNYPYTSASGGSKDLMIRIYSISPLRVTFQWRSYGFSDSNGDEIELFGSGSPPYTGQIEVYRQYYRYVSGQWQGYNLSNENPPSKGSSFSDSLFLNYPLDGRNLPSNYAVPVHVNPGEIRGNITIDETVSTPTTLLDNPTNILVSNKTLMVVSSGITFNMITPTSPSNGFNNLIIDTLSRLFVYSNAKIVVNSQNTLSLRKNSLVHLFTASSITINQGGKLCNQGASIIHGNGQIIFKGGSIHHQQCLNLSDYWIKDSVKFILDTNAVLEIPDSTTLHFTGKETSLILRANSKLKFGQNSKILIDSGAKLVANNAEFSSIDSTKSWHGIVLNGTSKDTIKNCTIQNAVTGIAIVNKTNDSAHLYSTEVSGCNFVNKTNSALNSGIYVYNSKNILIMNNNITSGSSPSGFVFGIYAEYCPAGNFNIIGNSITKSDKGMAIIQSSPYIARNVLNGNSTCESGLLLDNSNGTIEYNIIDDFYYSYFSYYSSPNLLKNTFDNSFEDNLYLGSSSAPVMHALSSESITNYFAGGNVITGSSSNAGIYFYDESFPDMNDGYNSFTISGTGDYLSGDIPSELDGKMFVENNYWGETPQSSRFNISGGTVHYSPYQSSALSEFDSDYSDLYDIGFGMYDSVLVKDDSDNPSLAEDIYLQAYQKEYSKQYSEAIELYKEIVSEYKDSLFVASSLSRIFNCYEKKISDYSEYNSLETYYRNILTDTSYSELIKNISEDFMIKSKVKNFKTQEAIDDYNSIYLQNQNTPKGTHALINREILTSILESFSMDNPGIDSEFENMMSRQERIIEIMNNLRHERENILSPVTSPVNYTLSQNYPNPFNPSTNISYTIPKDGFVKIKVYDITGKEIRNLINEFKQAGSYNINFDGQNLSSGVYYYKLESWDFFEIKKMILIK